MIASIHQPHFLPWPGYFNKVLQSDVFVWLHTVQYRKNYFQNRTRVKNLQGGEAWLTLPVHAKLGTAIDEVTIADPRWRDRISKTIEQYYRKAPYFGEIWPRLTEAIEIASDNLDQANYRLFLSLIGLFDGNRVNIHRADEMEVTTDDPTLRLVEMCVQLGADTYIAGRGGRNYMKVEEFEKRGIRVIWQMFDPASAFYPQMGETFIPGLSIIDCLFNTGVEKTRALVCGAWSPEIVETGRAL